MVYALACPVFPNMRGLVCCGVNVAQCCTVLSMLVAGVVRVVCPCIVPVPGHVVWCGDDEDDG
jgi:hypothetical protein